MVTSRTCLGSLVVIAAAWQLAASDTAVAEGYRVGVAKVDVTPDYPIRLNGFGTRRAESEGVTQPIWAKALAIRWGEDPLIVLLAIDSLGVRSTMVDEVARRLEAKYQIPARERGTHVLAFPHDTESERRLREYFQRTDSRAASGSYRPLHSRVDRRHRTGSRRRDRRSSPGAARMGAGQTCIGGQPTHAGWSGRPRFTDPGGPR